MVDDEDDLDISTEIWKLFGKNKSQYVERDVFSDDEDMEADARDVEREELKRCVLIIFLGALPLMDYALVTVWRKRKIRWHWKRSGDTKRRSGGRRRCLEGVNSFSPIFCLSPLVLVYCDPCPLIHRALLSPDFSSVLSKLPLYINIQPAFYPTGFNCICLLLSRTPAGSWWITVPFSLLSCAFTVCLSQLLSQVCASISFSLAFI
jgi:hypothetical protein